jgi:hypothetical protein
MMGTIRRRAAHHLLDRILWLLSVLTLCLGATVPPSPGWHTGEDSSPTKACSEHANATLRIEGYATEGSIDDSLAQLVSCLLPAGSDGARPLYIQDRLNVDPHAPSEVVMAMSHALMMIDNLSPKDMRPWVDVARGRSVP